MKLFYYRNSWKSVRTRRSDEVRATLEREDRSEVEEVVYGLVLQKILPDGFVGEGEQILR